MSRLRLLGKLDMGHRPIPVYEDPALPVSSDDGEAVLVACFLVQERQIRLSSECDAADLYHEVTHAALYDSGMANFFAASWTEALCDAIGTQLARALGWPRGLKKPSKYGRR